MTRKKTVSRQKSGGRKGEPKKGSHVRDSKDKEKQSPTFVQKRGAIRAMLHSEVKSLAYVMQDEALVGEVMQLYDSGQYSRAAQTLEGYAESTMDPVLIRGASAMASQVAMVSRPQILKENVNIPSHLSPENITFTDANSLHGPLIYNSQSARDLINPIREYLSKMDEIEFVGHIQIFEVGWHPSQYVVRVTGTINEEPYIVSPNWGGDELEEYVSKRYQVTTRGELEYTEDNGFDWTFTIMGGAI